MVQCIRVHGDILYILASFQCPYLLEGLEYYDCRKKCTTAKEIHYGCSLYFGWGTVGRGGVGGRWGESASLNKYTQNEKEGIPWVFRTGTILKVVLGGGVNWII